MLPKSSEQMNVAANRNDLPKSPTKGGSDMKSIELLCLAHRYLYYVKNAPAISDYRYDLLESEALKAISHDSLLNKPGSDRAEDYPKEAIELAEKLAA